MAELSESSGLLSLTALRKHEAERSQKQAEDARAQAEAEQRSRAAVERARARLVEEQRERERAAQRSVENARLTELAEIERTRSAEFERAEREARARRDLDVRLLEERTAHHQAQIVLLGRIARQRLLTTFSSALCIVTWLASAGIYLGLLRPDAERAQVAFERSLADERQARRSAEMGDARATQQSASLAKRVSSLEEALRAARFAQVLKPTAAGVPRKPEHRQPMRGVTPSHVPCRDADDGDPLNPCLKR